MDDDDGCYICQQENTKDRVFCPCSCETRQVHESCIKNWIQHKPEKKSYCEVCLTRYNCTFKTDIKLLLFLVLKEFTFRFYTWIPILWWNLSFLLVQSFSFLIYFG